MREQIAKKIYDWGYENEYLEGSSKVWNFVDDAEPEKDGIRDLSDQILTLIREEIKGELDGREEDMIADIDYEEGWLDCKHWILKALEV